jgi:hypothetical protein
MKLSVTSKAFPVKLAKNILGLEMDKKLQTFPRRKIR